MDETSASNNVDKDRPRLSRRQFLGTAAGVAVAVGAGSTPIVVSGQGRQAGPSGGGTDPDLILINGRFHTMDDRNTIARAVSIRNGRFLSVGNATPARGRTTRVIDLRGRTVVPGIIEGHIHSVSLANRPGYHTILENTTSIREIQEALAARRKDVPAGQWITSMGGWHPNQWAEHRHPTRQELDAAVPDRPVLLYERFTGPCVTNSLGQGILRCRRCGAARASEHREGERCRQRRDRRGRLCGWRAVGQRAVSSAPAADVRGQEAEHA